MGNPTSDAAGAAARILETEPVKNLLSPVTREIGLLAGDVAGLVRFYVTSNLEKVFTKWGRQRNNRPLQAADVAKVIPLLQAASLQSDDELQERWAALLESTVSIPDGVVPSFGQTLSLLTPDEAGYLDRLYLRATNQDFGELRRLGSFDKMSYFYNPERNDQAKESQVHLLIQDLERLGLIWREQKREDNDIFVAPDSRTFIGSTVETIYYFSDYGLRFIQAVTPKAPMADQR